MQFSTPDKKVFRRVQRNPTYLTAYLPISPLKSGLSLRKQIRAWLKRASATFQNRVIVSAQLSRACFHRRISGQVLSAAAWLRVKAASRRNDETQRHRPGTRRWHCAVHAPQPRTRQHTPAEPGKGGRRDKQLGGSTSGQSNPSPSF